MKVILSKDVAKLGKRGDVVNVSDGYGRNYLLPHGLGSVATDSAVAQAKVRVQQKAKAVQEGATSLTKFVKKVQGKCVRIAVKASSGGKLYAGVEAGELGNLLAKAWKLKPGEMLVTPDLAQPLKDLGKYPLDVEFSSGSTKQKVGVILEVVSE